MIEDFRLPDPPPSLREQVLAGARATPRAGRRFAPLAGLAAAAVLLGGVLWVVFTAPAARHGRPAQAPPADELRYSVMAEENGNLYTLKVSRFTAAGQTVERLSVGSVAGKWALMTGGETAKACVVPELGGDADPDPKVEERSIMESGYILCFRGKPGQDGTIDADVRFYVVEKRALGRSVLDKVSLKPGEERVVKISK